MRKFRDFTKWLKSTPSQSAFAVVVKIYYPMTKDEVFQVIIPWIPGEIA